MNYYLDSSALVKAYVDERRSDDMRALLREAATEDSTQRSYVSRTAYPEAMSAFTRLRKEGKLSAEEAELQSRFLESDFAGPEQPYEILEPVTEIVNKAADLVRQHALRGF